MTDSNGKCHKLGGVKLELHDHANKKSTGHTYEEEDKISINLKNNKVFSRHVSYLNLTGCGRKHENFGDLKKSPKFPGNRGDISNAIEWIRYLSCFNSNKKKII